jgi:hypothetical protein
MAELDHLSYSSISLYTTCPAAWEKKYVEKIPTPTSAALVFGSAFHTAVESLVGSRAAGKVVDAPVLWSGVWNQTIEGKDIVWNGDLPEELSNQGLRMLTHKDTQKVLHSISPMLHPDGEPIIEQRVELRVPGVPVPIVGYIDVVLADGSPADFKTAARMWTQDQAEKELQPVYYIAALNQAGHVVPEGRFTHFVFTKTKTPQAAAFETRHEISQVFWLFNLIERTWRAIESGSFPPNPSSWKCSEKWCDYWTMCRGKR